MTTARKLKDFLPVLKLLVDPRVKNHVKCSLVECQELIRVLSLLALNTLKGRVPITPTQKRRMLRYKQTLKKLSTKTCSHNTKTRLVQKGGGPFLLSLIPAAISALTSLFNR